MTANSLPSAVLRNGASIEDPLGVVLGLRRAWRLDVSDPVFSDPTRPASFGEPDLRRANQAGARISAAQIAAILERRPAIEQTLQAIAPGASLAGPADAVPWLPLEQLFGTFAGLRGVGYSKMTKALHPKRPALIPLLDSIVQKYLQDDDLGPRVQFAERALGLVRGYQRDLNRNQASLRTVQQELAGRGYGLTEVRILDLLILSAAERPAMAQRSVPSLGWRGVHHPGETTPDGRRTVLERRPDRGVLDRVRAHRAQGDRRDHLVLVVGGALTGLG